MTYCIATRVNAGIVFLSDSRTNAGVDHIGTFRKMAVFERTGERVIVMLSAGNLAVTQSVRQLLCYPSETGGHTIWTAPTMFDVAKVVGQAIRAVYQEDAASLNDFGIEFNCSLIIGGQIKGAAHRLFNMYPAGNFIEASDENLYFQIGESKYGKPILDRVIQPETSLDESAKCCLISMDSTLHSNLSVGLPLDLLCYEANSLCANRFVNIDSHNNYYQMIRQTWDDRLKQAFLEIPNPAWSEADFNPAKQASLKIPDPTVITSSPVQQIFSTAPMTQAPK